MKIHGEYRSRKVVAAIFIVFLLAGGIYPAVCSADVVAEIIDGDTVVMGDGSRVRLVGVDSPEAGEPWSREAADWMERESRGKDIRLVKCEERDKYGRILAVLVRGKDNLNLKLLAEGLAVPMLIPPCGKLLVPDAMKRAAEALLNGRGLYSQPEFQIVGHGRSRDLIGRSGVVRGRIRSLYRGPKATHLNFGPDWRTDFTAVIFSQGRARFQALGLEVGELVGREVLVIGPVREYNGPEIVVRYPEQILPLAGPIPEGEPGPMGEDPAGKRDVD